MTTTKRNQQGSGVIELFIIMLVMALLGVVGWLVFRNRQNSNVESSVNTPANKTSASASQQSQPEYLSINELGLKLKLTDATKDLTYYIDTNGDAILSSAALAKEEPKCAANYTAGNAYAPRGVAKVTSFTNPDGYDIASADTNSVAAPDAVLVNGKYYYIRTNQSFCVNVGMHNNPTDKAYQIEISLVRALRDTLKLEKI